MTSGVFNLSLTFVSGIIEFAVPVSRTKIFSEANSVEKYQRNHRFKTVHVNNKELRSLPELREEKFPDSK